MLGWGTLPALTEFTQAQIVLLVGFLVFAFISAWPERTLAAKAVLPSGPVLCHFLFFKFIFL